jgi:hypothetical protein
LANQLIRPQSAWQINDGPILRCERLGGILNYYYRAAA